MAQRLDGIWRYCAPCGHFWKPPGNDWSCLFCGGLGLISFTGPELRSAHEHPTVSRIDKTWDERWLDGQFTLGGVPLPRE